MLNFENFEADGTKNYFCDICREQIPCGNKYIEIDLSLTGADIEDCIWMCEHCIRIAAYVISDKD